MKTEIQCKKLPYVIIKDIAEDSVIVYIKRGYIYSVLLSLQILLAKADYNKLDTEIAHLLEEIREIA